MARTFRIATRKSKMAMVQTNGIISRLQKVAPEHTFEALGVTSDGCYEKYKGAIKDLGGKGAFTKALEIVMLAGDAEMAMHSMKDVPTDENLPGGLALVSMMPRDDIRDAVVCRKGESFVSLKEGAKVGTSSARRAAQIRAHFPHLDVVPLRGNADTRIAKVDSGEVDAAVLAASGLKRIGLEHRISEIFEPDMMCPAAAQGIVGVEARTDDEELLSILKKINHEDAYRCVMAERAMLEALGGNCNSAIGGFCEVTQGGNLRLIAAVFSEDGQTVLRAREKMGYDDYMVLGNKVAEDLLAQGAKDLLGEHG